MYNIMSSIRELITRCQTKVLFIPDGETFYDKGFVIKGKTFGENDKIYKITHRFAGLDYVFFAIIPQVGECCIYLENMLVDNTIASEGQFNEVDYSTVYWTISASPKKYCIELLDEIRNGRNEIWISFIQQCQICNLPSTAKCKGLGGIFGLIHSLLTSYNISGSIYLEDDSQYLATCWEKGREPAFGVSTFLNRLLLGKKTIYEEYSFYPVDEDNRPLNYNPMVKVINDTQIMWNNKVNTIGNIMNEYFTRITPENKESYEALLKIIRDDERLNSIYFAIRKIIARMKNDNIDTLKKNCSLVGGMYNTSNASNASNYYNKYKKYKMKYMKLTNSNHL